MHLAGLEKHIPVSRYSWRKGRIASWELNCLAARPRKSSISLPWLCGPGCLPPISNTCYSPIQRTAQICRTCYRNFRCKAVEQKIRPTRRDHREGRAMKVLLILAVGLLSFANGANDNFKGVATLWGAGLTTYRRAIVWATGFTFLGSLTAIWLGSALAAKFIAPQLVDGAVVSHLPFLTA